LFGIICKISFTSIVTSCYQVHTDTHLSAALLCYLVGTISLSCELVSLSKGAAFVHARAAQLCTENGVSIYMCSAVEVV